MIPGLYISRTGLDAMNRYLDITSDNLANVNTNAFKRSRPDFEDLFYATTREPGAFGAAGIQMPTGIQPPSGVRVAGVLRSFRQGPLEETLREMDVAILGEGFFRVRLPDGTAGYTRDGALSTDAQRRLVAADKLLIDPPITLPPGPGTIVIFPDGRITATAGNVTTEVGQLRMARFINPSGLDSIGHNAFRESSNSGPAQEGTPGSVGFGVLRQYQLERSNVEVVNELTNLIAAQRAFTANSRVAQTTFEMLQSAVDIIP